jgi:hypothetical protein
VLGRSLMGQRVMSHTNVQSHIAHHGSCERRATSQLPRFPAVRRQPWIPSSSQTCDSTSLSSFGTLPVFRLRQWQSRCLFDWTVRFDGPFALRREHPFAREPCEGVVLGSHGSTGRISGTGNWSSSLVCCLRMEGLSTPCIRFSRFHAWKE